MRNAEATRSTIFKYSAFQFFFSLLVWLPVFYEFQKRIGLNDLQIFHIQSAYYLIFCFLELPTGFVADVFGYRNCLKLGALSLIVANLLPIFAQSFSGFFAHFALIALARSFVSGASSAYLYEFLARNGDGARYKLIEGRARGYSLVGKIVCWAMVGALMQWHLTMPYWLTTASAVISLYYAFVLPEVALAPRAPTPPGTGFLRTSLEQFGSTFRYVYRNPFLIFVIFQGVGIFVLTRICQVNLFQPILDSKKLPLWSYGVIMSGMTLFEAVGSSYPKLLQGRLNNRVIVTLLTVGMAIALMLIPSFRAVGALACLGIFSLAAGASFPIQKQLMNDAIEGGQQYRATILSLESVVDRAVCAWIASLLGVALATGHLNRFLELSGVVTLAAFGVLTLAFYFYHWRACARSGRSFQLGEHIYET